MDPNSYRNTYVIEVPKGYPRSGELLDFLLANHSDSEGYEIVESEGCGAPRCTRAETPPSLVLTDTTTGEKWGAGIHDLDDVLAKFLGSV
jgi:hypothetical protein